MWFMVAIIVFVTVVSVFQSRRLDRVLAEAERLATVS